MTWHHSILPLIAAIVGASPAFSAPAPADNLLTVNPGFEGEKFNTYAHGVYHFQGWEGNNYLYNRHSTVEQDSPEGARHFHMDWGGSLSTASEARPAAIPGLVYELRYQLRTLAGNFPEEYLGTRSYIDFYNVAGEKIKTIWGPDWFPQSQAQGAAPWEVITVRGVAPAGTATVGVRIDAPGGTFYNQEKNRTQNRHVEVDDFSLRAIPETSDRLALRRFPRLVEPGKPAILAIHHAAIAPRRISVRLLDKSGAVIAEAGLRVTTGRGLDQLQVPVPATIKPGSYSWQVSLMPSGDKSAKPLAVLNEGGVFSDETVSQPAPEKGSADFDANHPNIVRMGRWDDSDPKKQGMNWFGSEIRARFNGTSLTLLGSPKDKTRAVKFNVVVDGDESHILVVKAEQMNAPIPLVSGLSEGIHDVRIFKVSESGEPFVFTGLRVDSAHGLLRPEPLPTRKIEIFGDSVTSGGSASPAYLGYAPMLGRELNADVHIISKGGTGVASSFSHLITLPKYWDRLSCENLFDASKSPAWDFNRWKPDGVVVMTGHNDQFNNGLATFTERYREFIGELRRVYPTTTIVCGNTVISTPVSMFQKALQPVLSQDPKVSLVFQWSSWVDSKSGHPPTAGHAAMVLGDAKRFSLADVVEDRLGWGLDASAK